MSNHEKETRIYNSAHQDSSNLNENDINDLETDACPDPDSILSSCIRGNKSSDSETEENESNARNKTKSNKLKSEEVKVKYNTRALTNLAQTYMLELFDKNLLIIFNQININGYLPRNGTCEDSAALLCTFAQYGFQCERHDDWTRQQILDELDNFSSRDFTDYGCIVVAVLTHGTYGGMLKAKDREYSEHDILRRLKSRDKPTLVTKPVVLLIQACRGKENPEGVSVRKETIEKDTYDENSEYYLPIEADTLVFHSSYVGKPSYRPASGSWFIQILCKKIDEMFDHHDLESIMTEVKREVACNKESIVENNKVVPPKKNTASGGSKELALKEHFAEHHKQMPIVTSALTRKLYLKRKQVNIATTSQMLPLTLSRDTIDNVVPTIPSTYSHMEESDPCLCFLDHFDYMKNCLSHYVAENYSDNFAQHLLNTSLQQKKTDTEIAKSNLKIISKYLHQSMDSKYQKYIYFYGNDSDELDDRKLIGKSKFGVAQRLKELKRHVPGVIVGVGVCAAMRFLGNVINK